MGRPGRVCTVCSHPQALEIDRACLAGESGPDIERRFGVSRDSLWRHRRAHLRAGPPEPPLPADMAAPEMPRLLDALERRLIVVLRKAETAGDTRSILAGVRAAERIAALRRSLTEATPPTPGDRRRAAAQEDPETIRARVLDKLNALGRGYNAAPDG